MAATADGDVWTLSIRRSAETITIPNIQRLHNTRTLWRKQKRNQEMKGHEMPVSNDWESIQLARYPDESRKKITSLMMDGVYSGVYLLKETNASVFRSILISSITLFLYHWAFLVTYLSVHTQTHPTDLVGYVLFFCFFQHTGACPIWWWIRGERKSH